MTANERDSRVAVVYRCFSKGGDSIHDQPGCARAHILLRILQKFALNKLLACTNTSSKVELKSIQLIHKLNF